MDVLDVVTLRRKPADRQLRDAARVIRRIVEHLNLEQASGIFDRAHRLDQAIGDVHLVVQRQLNRDDRHRIERRRRLRLLVAIRHVQVHEVVPVPSINREDDQHKEVRAERQGFSEGHVRVKRRFILLLGSEWRQTNC